MNKTSLLIKPTILSITFLLLTSPVFAANTDIKGKNLKSLPKMEISAVKNKICKSKEEDTKTRMTQLTKLVASMETVFDRIAEGVKKYYTDKVLTSGKTVTNYDKLVKDIADKKALIQTQLDKAKSDIGNLNCEDGTAKNTTAQFHTNMKAVKEGLKNYRKSVNTLIVAVHTVDKNIKVSPTITPAN